MSHDPNPFNPASEYDTVRGPREDRAKLDQRTITPTTRTDEQRHADPTEVCPERNDDGFCKPSLRGKRPAPFFCKTGLVFKGCGIYITERRKK